jgi:hypothetical protein
MFKTGARLRVGGLLVLTTTLVTCAKAEEPYKGPPLAPEEFSWKSARATFNLVDGQRKSTYTLCYSSTVTRGDPFKGDTVYTAVKTQAPGERQFTLTWEQAATKAALIRRKGSGIESIVLKQPLQAGAAAWKTPSDFTPSRDRRPDDMTCQVTKVSAQQWLKSDSPLATVTVKCDVLTRDTHYTRTETFAQYIGLVTGLYTESRADGSQEKTLITEQISDFEPKPWKETTSSASLDCD